MIDPNNSPLNKPSDNFAFKDDQEKDELLPEIQDLRLRMEIRFRIFILVGMALFALGAILYGILKGA